MKEDTNQETNVVEIKPEEMGVIYQQDKATIDMQISTAKAYPRNITRATENAIATVTMDKETASTCTYAVPRSGKMISGASVHLAKILAQYWGNLRIEAKVIAIAGAFQPLLLEPTSDELPYPRRHQVCGREQAA